MGKKHQSLKTLSTIGIDIGKNTFHLIGLDEKGFVVVKRKFSRGQAEKYLSNKPRCLIGMEACVGSHYLAHQLLALGHDVRLMAACYVKPFLKGQKNDYSDAEAIAEAVQRPNMRFVSHKTQDQLDLQALHRMRSRLVRHRTAVINQIRAFLLERGIAVRQGFKHLQNALPDILGTETEKLSPIIVHMIEDLSEDWRRLDDRIQNVTSQIENMVAKDTSCQRLLSVPGVGPIIASAMVALTGDGSAFEKGRDFSAWLGLVPRQMSTGDRTILGRITKRGNSYLRTLFMQGAWVILMRSKNWKKYSFGAWLESASKRLHKHVLATALASKLARIAWSVLYHKKAYCYAEAA